MQKTCEHDVEDCIEISSVEVGLLGVECHSVALFTFFQYFCIILGSGHACARRNHFKSNQFTGLSNSTCAPKTIYINLLEKAILVSGSG